MSKKKKVSAWPLSVLVFFVSFLSVLAVLKQVQAVWIEPNYLPGDTHLSNNFVFTPLAQNLDLGTRNITGNGNINIDGSVTAGAGSFTSLLVNGAPVNGGGGGSNSDLWLSSGSPSGDLYYTTSTGSGRVGIGLSAPLTNLHIASTTGPIVTLSGLNTNYRGLTIKDMSGVEQWFYGAQGSNNNFVIRRSNTTDNLTINSGTGNIGISTSTPDTKLHIYDASNGPIVTLSGLNTNYRGLTIKNTAGVEQWFYGPNDNNNFVVRSGGDSDRIVVNSAGQVGIGVNPLATSLVIASTTSNTTALVAVSNKINGGGVSGSGLGYGIYGSSTNGTGVYGFAASPTGVGVTGYNPAGGLAGKFDGDVSVTGNLDISNTGKYLKIVSGVGAPPASDCASSAHNGRLYIDTTSGSIRLYACVGLTWRSNIFDSGGSGAKESPIVPVAP